MIDFLHPGIACRREASLWDIGIPEAWEALTSNPAARGPFYLGFFAALRPTEEDLADEDYERKAT